MDAKKRSLEDLNRLDIEAYKTSKKTPIIVVLDDIRSALNVGSFFRTCDALAIEKLILCGITAQPPHKEIMKTAIGATSSVDWSYEEEIETYLKSINDEYTIISVEQTNQSISLDQVQKHIDFHQGQKFCLIFGNEVNGVCDNAIAQSRYCIEIPQFGTKHSFNVSVCGGIVLWDFWKQINQK